MTYTPTLEHFNKIESKLQEERQNPRYSTENTKTLTTYETPKNIEKQKAMNFQISKIMIGEWTHKSVYPDDLKAKFYFAKKRLMWEILDEDSKLKRKIEIQWSDVLSLRASYSPQNETGVLEVEVVYKTFYTSYLLHILSQILSCFFFSVGKMSNVLHGD